jgi:hypothetical protein
MEALEMHVSYDFCGCRLLAIRYSPRQGVLHYQLLSTIAFGKASGLLKVLGHVRLDRLNNFDHVTS